MPLLKNLVDCGPNKPSLKQRAASLKAAAAKAIRPLPPKAPARDDAELLALEVEFLAADAHVMTTSDRLVVAEDAYVAPPTPVALCVYSHDWMFNGIPQTRMTDLGGGKARVHGYGRDEVEFLRANPCMGVYVGGKEGELQPDGVSRKRPDRQAQARADMIVSAWDEWQAALATAREAVDLPALEAAHERALEQRDAVLMRIREARAMSLVGLGVKARAAASMWIADGAAEMRINASGFSAADADGLLYTLAADAIEIVGEPTRG